MRPARSFLRASGCIAGRRLGGNRSYRLQIKERKKIQGFEKVLYFYIRKNCRFRIFSRTGTIF